MDTLHHNHETLVVSYFFVRHGTIPLQVKMVNCKKTSEIKQCNEWTPQIGQQSRLMIFSKIINIFYVVSTIEFTKRIYSCHLKDN